MTFYEEPGGYEKTALSDLQGAWENLRSAVLENHPFPESERLLFHINEGMSWESVRDLDRMKEALLLVRNIAVTGQAPGDILFWIDMVWENMEEVLNPSD
jgi:hypothetical protein